MREWTLTVNRRGSHLQVLDYDVAPGPYRHDSGFVARGDPDEQKIPEYVLLSLGPGETFSVNGQTISHGQWPATERN